MSIIRRIDSVAAALENKGLRRLASELDIVANTLEAGDPLEKLSAGLAPDPKSLLAQARKRMDSHTLGIVNKVLSGDTALLEKIISEAQGSGDLAHLDDATFFGLRSASLSNASKVISALLLAASLAMAGGQHPTGVLGELADYAKKNPNMEKVLHKNIQEIEALGAKGLSSVEKAHGTIHSNQEAAEKARLDAQKAPQAPNPADDVWRT